MSTLWYMPKSPRAQKELVNDREIKKESFHHRHFSHCPKCKFDWSITRIGEIMRSVGIQIKNYVKEETCPLCKGEDVRIVKA